ncbi:MAG: GDP-mannose 4,6-dehydratase [Alphaproteobacteria bacterium]|nr:GDP-mannose 4,6-dehydratase [Alphaproteobacteria bacterium]
MKKALIFGITGQDGSYLAELLLGKGYAVHGVTRRTSTGNRTRIQRILDKITLHEGDLADAGSIWRIIKTVEPDEVYNLAAQTHVHTSFAEPEHTGQINALGPIRILEAIRTINPRIRYYQASTSELFGQGTADGKPLNEQSPMRPASPYGAAKLYAYTMARLYREAYGLFVCNGILFNHESPRRGADFVTHKIAAFAKTVKQGRWDGTPLKLGNLEAQRDWGHARDYVEGMWMMLQYTMPDDYVLATGQTFSVKAFAEKVLGGAGLKLVWDTQGASDAQGRKIITVDPSLLRPIDVPCLLGDSTHAQKQLGWKPSCTLDELVTEMLAA